MPVFLVTACVDNIVMMNPFFDLVRDVSGPNGNGSRSADLARKYAARDFISSNVDMIMRGSVIWTGTSSLIVRVIVDEQKVKNGEDVGEPLPLLQSDFLFVAKFDLGGKYVGPKMIINPVVPETPLEEKLFRDAAKAKEARVHEAKTSLELMDPTPEEAHYIHDLYRRGELEASQEDIDNIRSLFPLRGSENGHDTVHQIPMAATTITSTIITQPQEQNIWGKIFGGFLMRKAFEVAYSAVVLFYKSHVDPSKSSTEKSDAFSLLGNYRIDFVAVDDINFLRPVEIGSVVTFTARIVYNEERATQVLVETEVYDLNKQDRFVSNNFSFTFAVVDVDKETDELECMKVVPRSYADAMDYLSGRRAFIRTRESLEQIGSPYARYLQPRES